LNKKGRSPFFDEFRTKRCLSVTTVLPPCASGTGKKAGVKFAKKKPASHEGLAGKMLGGPQG
jgi:hypothetical protein